MTLLHRVGAAGTLVLALAGCGASAPPAVPAGAPSEAVSGSVVDEARSVVHQVEERSMQIDASVRDPFAPAVGG